MDREYKDNGIAIAGMIGGSILVKPSDLRIKDARRQELQTAADFFSSEPVDKLHTS